MSISSLQNALTGMQVAQSQLNIVGSNIANMDTEGYTRKSAQAQSVVMAGNPAGVALGATVRNVSESLLKSYLLSSSSQGSLSAQSQYLSSAETFLGTAEGNDSISANVANLHSAFVSFSTDVSSVASRYEVLNAATTFTSRLNYLSEEIQKLRGDADMQLSEVVAEVNAALDKIDELNDNIVKYTALSYDGLADLQDKRDMALKELSSLIDITYFTRGSGEIVVQTKKGTTLLDNDPHYLSHTSMAQGSAMASYEGGSIDGIYVDGKDITKEINSGEAFGLITIRDTTLPALQSQLDELAGVMKEKVNIAHNQGTSFPDISDTLSGTREFINPQKQTVTITSGDSRFIVFDTNGNQVASATFVQDLGLNGKSVDEIVKGLNEWLTSPDGANLSQANVSLNADGQVQIYTGDSQYCISIIDEATSVMGSEQKPAEIAFDTNADGITDRTFEGLSNFFGLNDFFVTDRPESSYTSKITGLNNRLAITGNATITFADKNHPDGIASITLNGTDTLETIAKKINSDPALSSQLVASVISTGNAYVLHISNSFDGQLEIYENGTNTGALSVLGLQTSDSGLASSMQVRSDIVINANKIAAGAPQFSSLTGEYSINGGSNSVANKMAEVFNSTLDFKAAGTMAATQTTLANYAATFVGNLASSASTTSSSLEYQQQLTNSIATKEAQLSGVDMDEELSMMIIYQQAYSACAQVFSASKEMLDVLINTL